MSIFRTILLVNAGRRDRGEMVAAGQRLRAMNTDGTRSPGEARGHRGMAKRHLCTEIPSCHVKNLVPYSTKKSMTLCGAGAGGSK